MSLGVFVDSSALGEYARQGLPAAMAVGEAFMLAGEAGDVVGVSVLGYALLRRRLVDVGHDPAAFDKLIGGRAGAVLPFTVDHARVSWDVAWDELPRWHELAMAVEVGCVMTVEPQRYAGVEIEVLDLREEY